ncbi:hypothetical protein [Streptomyces sp. NPDC059759]|uniref:hypothetical protein n=1 Tax=Streptomyces sp. NPDC059759 TaxID=3346936 RepID=UPI00364FE574
MGDLSLRDRLTGIVGPTLARRVIALLDEEALTPCRDTDCVRIRSHSRLGFHLWRHPVGAPIVRGLLGRKCFNCGQYAWRRIHRAGPAS